MAARAPSEGTTRQCSKFRSVPRSARVIGVTTKPGAAGFSLMPLRPRLAHERRPDLDDACLGLSPTIFASLMTLTLPAMPIGAGAL